MFSGLKALAIPEGNVVKVEYNGAVLWQLEESAPYTNQVPISIDADGSIYDGDGWIAKKRLSSSGALKDANYVSTTGFIPATSGAEIRIGGCKWINSDAQSANYVCSYDANFNFVCAVNCGGGYGGGTVSGDEEIAVVTLPTNKTNIAYVRVSAYSDIVGGPGASMIVTVNEEIV